MIVSFTGPKGHGKDTFARMFVQRYPSPSRFQFLALSDPIKEICKIMFGWDESYFFDRYKKENIDFRWGVSPRHAMQYLGTEIGQYGLCEQFPLFKETVGRLLWSKRLTDMHDREQDLVITDMRFPHEYNWIKQYAEHIHVPYYNFTIVRSETSMKDVHESEMSFFDIPRDCLIDNQLKEDIPYQVDKLLEIVCGDLDFARKLEEYEDGS